MTSHRVHILVDPQASQLMTRLANRVTLKTSFVAAVKQAYDSGQMQQREPSELVNLLEQALRAVPLGVQTSPSAQLRPAIDAALHYLYEQGQIKLRGQSAKAA